jgi:hypothetical protein
MILSLAWIGVFFLVHRQQLPSGNVSLAAGFMYVFASILSLNQFLAYGYYFAFFNPFSVIASAMGAACYLAHKTTW